MGHEYSQTDSRLEEARSRIPAFMYLKEPVQQISDLYIQYPQGGERGWFAFVTGTGSFAWWDTQERKWQPLAASEAERAIREAAEEALRLAIEAETGSRIAAIAKVVSDFQSADTTLQRNIESERDSLLQVLQQEAQARADGDNTEAQSRAAAFAEALEAAGNAHSAANSAHSAVGALGDYVNEAFHDSIITESEALAIGSYINQITATQSEMNARYEELYANVYLAGSSKNNLASAKVAFDGAVELLLLAIDQAIADGKTTADEKATVDAAFAAYHSAYSAMGAAIEAAYESIQNALKAYSDDVAQAGKDAQNYILNTLPDVIGALQQQLDGQVISWFDSYDPTLSNAPASGWTTPEDRSEHLYDTFTNKETGKSWRFEKNASGEYVWAEIGNTTAINALMQAAAAKDAADGKRRTFVAEPTTPYDVGDLWSKELTDLYICITARKSGVFVPGDWHLASLYDNTQTVIDGGLITSGTIRLAGDGGDIKAGITGEGTAESSVRLWAGATEADKANAPFRVLQDGSVVMTKAQVDGIINATGGKFRNVEIIGSIRNPFTLIGDSISTGYNDNIVIPSTDDGWTFAFSLPWGVEQSGRKLCLLNYKWRDTTHGGTASASAPAGKYFYENGINVSSLSLSRELVELIGYGDATNFYGWIVLNRINLMTNGKYGRGLKILAQGIVTCTYANRTPVITYKTYDGSSMYVSRSDEGEYTVHFSSVWGLTSTNYIVMLTGYGYNQSNPNPGKGSSDIKATLISRSSNSFLVHTSDDATVNDGGFTFMISNMNDWT